MRACVFIVLFTNVLDSASADVVQSLREQVVACWRAGALLQNPAAQQLLSELNALKQSHDKVTENGDFTKLAKASQTQTHSCDAVVAQLNALKNDYAEIETAAEEHEDREDPGELDEMRRLRWILIGLLYKAKHRETEVIVTPVNQVVGPEMPKEKCCAVPICSAGSPPVVAKSYCSCACPDESDCTCCDKVVVAMMEGLPRQPVFAEDITDTEPSLCTSQCVVAQLIKNRQDVENDLHIKHVELNPSNRDPELGCEFVGSKEPQETKVCEVPVCTKGSLDSSPVVAKTYCSCVCNDDEIEEDCNCCEDINGQQQRTGNLPLFAKKATDLPSQIILNRSSGKMPRQCDAAKYMSFRRELENELQIKHVEDNGALGCVEYRPLKEEIPEDLREWELEKKELDEEPKDLTPGDSSVMCYEADVRKYTPGKTKLAVMRTLGFDPPELWGSQIQLFQQAWKRQANRREKFIKMQMKKERVEKTASGFVHHDAEAGREYTNFETAARTIDQKIDNMLEAYKKAIIAGRTAECLVCCMTFRVRNSDDRAPLGFHIRLFGDLYRVQIDHQPYALVGLPLKSLHDKWLRATPTDMTNPCTDGSQSYRDIGNPLRQNASLLDDIKWTHTSDTEYMMLVPFEDCFNFQQAYDAQQEFLKTEKGKELCNEYCRSPNTADSRKNDTARSRTRRTVSGEYFVKTLYSESKKNRNCGMNTPCQTTCYKGDVCTYDGAEDIEAEEKFWGPNACRSECSPKRGQGGMKYLHNR